MKRSALRGIAVLGMATALGLGAAAPAVAHDSHYSSTWTWSASTLAAKFEAKADYLRYKANRLEYAAVLSDAQADVLQTRLRSSANDLDALAADTRTMTTQTQLEGAYADYKAELASLAPTLRAVKQATYGTALRFAARYLDDKADTLQAKLDALEAGNDIAAEDATAVQAAINAARVKINTALASLSPAVLGVRIMTDADAASTTLSTNAKRIYGAKFWLRTAAYALYD